MAGPKNIHGEAVSSKNIVLLEKAINSTYWMSGKEVNRMLMEDVYKEFVKFNIGRTGLVNSIITFMNVFGINNVMQQNLNLGIARFTENKRNIVNPEKG